MEDQPNKINETENIDQEVNQTNNVFTQSNSKFNEPKNKTKSFIIKYIVFVIILVLLTAGACYYTIVYKNNDNQTETQEETTEKNTIEKKKAEDCIYAINSYTETYNENPITIEKLYYKNGEIYTKWPNGNTNEFVKISGLKDKSVEEKINKRFKDVAEEWKDIGTSSGVYVSGNFSNILSVEMYYSHLDSNETERKTFNIDLNTGEDIPFEKIFVSSAPVKSMLIESLYENLSWINKKEDDTEETWEDSYNMDNVDTSDYEDKSLLLARKYDKKKDDIKYLVSPTAVTIFNLIDNDIIDEKYYYNHLDIKLYKYKEEIAIYKRYLNNDSIYEDDSKGIKNIIVFTTPAYAAMYQIMNYGKISDNIFMEEVKYLSDQNNNISDKFIENKSKELKEKIIQETPSNKGVICQRICSSHYYYDYKYHKYSNQYIEVSFQTTTTTCSKEYFKEDVFKDYIKMKSQARADVGLSRFDEWQKDKFPNLAIKYESLDYYLDLDGNIVANSYDEMGQYIELKIKEEEQQNQPELSENNPEDLEKDTSSEIETNTNNLKAQAGDYMYEAITDTYYHSAKLTILNSTDTSIEFDLSAAAGIDIDHVNIGQVSGTAKKIAEGIYRFEETIDGKTYEITFAVVGDNIIITETYPDNYNPYAGHNVYFTGEYKK